jgi:hypothetical protein
MQKAEGRRQKAEVGCGLLSAFCILPSAFQPLLEMQNSKCKINPLFILYF